MSRERLVSFGLQVVVIACIFGTWRFFSSDPNRFEEIYALALAVIAVGLLAEKMKPELSESSKREQEYD